MWTIVVSLIFAWVLAQFGFNEIVIQFVAETFDKQISDATYYVGFVILGAILTLFGGFGE